MALPDPPNGVRIEISRAIFAIQGDRVSALCGEKLNRCSL
jgi:hypothetical protein